jgi:phosphoribosyl-ATP pyrophosphohydrolase/phosphoribosyl-AMP cyclohydrolase
MSEKNITLEALFESIKKKIETKEEGSYTLELFNGGVDKIARKVGEEALEVVIASFLNEKNKSAQTHQDLIGEFCDSFYHSLVLMAQQKVEFSEIITELNKRNNSKK